MRRERRGALDSPTPGDSRRRRVRRGWQQRAGGQAFGRRRDALDARRQGRGETGSRSHRPDRRSENRRSADDRSPKGTQVIIGT